MPILLSEAKTSFTNFKRDITDVPQATFVEWCELLLYFIYERLKGEDPSRFIKETVYYSVTSPDTFTLPTDLMDMRQTGCGFYKLSEAEIYYDTQTANFTATAVLTGTTSGATATIISDEDDGTSGKLKVNKVSGVFQDNELITDGSGGSATVNGAPVYIISDTKLVEVPFGSTKKGYYVNRSNLVFTGSATTSFVFRYIPQPVSLADVTEYFTLDGTQTGVNLIEDRHKEYLMRALDVYYSQWDEDLNYESIADFRLVRALDEILSSVKRAPYVSQMYDNTNDY